MLTDVGPQLIGACTSFGSVAIGRGDRDSVCCAC